MANFQKSRFLSLTLRSLLYLLTIGSIGAALAITINPIEFVHFARDRQRNQDLQKISQAIRAVEIQTPELLQAEKNNVYISLPDGDPFCSSWLNKGLIPISSYFIYRCSPLENYRAVNGSGWLPINFADLASPPFDQLPIDPQNGKFIQGKLYYYQYIAGSAWTASYGAVESDAGQRRLSEIALKEELIKITNFVLENIYPLELTGSIANDFNILASGETTLAMVLVIRDGVIANEAAIVKAIGRPQYEELLALIAELLAFLQGGPHPSLEKFISAPADTSAVVQAATPSSIIEEIVKEPESTKICPDGAVILESQDCPVASKTCPSGAIVPEEQDCPTATKTCPNGSVIANDQLCPSITQTCPDGSIIPKDQSCPSVPPSSPPNPAVISYQGFDYAAGGIGPPTNPINNPISVFYQNVPIVLRMIIKNNQENSYFYVSQLKLQFKKSADCANLAGGSFISETSAIYFYNDRRNKQNIEFSPNGSLIWDVPLAFNSAASDGNYCLYADADSNQVFNQEQAQIILTTS